MRDYGSDDQLGLEKTPEEYVVKMVAVFAEVKRVLKKEGTMFLNLGDSYSGDKTGNIETKKNPKAVSDSFKKRMTNFAESLKRKFEEGVFFFGSPDPRGNSAESINILIYDKRSPDLVFQPFFAAKRVSIKNGQYDFCEVGSPFNSPVNCWISSSLHLALPDNADAKSFMNISNYIGIIITAGDLDADSSFCNAISLTIKNSKAPFSIKITRKPITKSGVNSIPVFDTISFYTGSESSPQVHTIDKAVSLLNSSKFFTCGLGDFQIREASQEKFLLSLHNGADVSFFAIRHIHLLFNNCLTPYYTILDKEIKRKNYYQAKQEIGIPFLVRQALMEDGWICRQTIIWAKPNPMPESVTDRCTKSHEYVFLLTKSPKYYFDNGAIKEPMREDALGRMKRGSNHKGDRGFPNGPQNHIKKYFNKTEQEAKLKFNAGRNKRSVWTVNTKPYAEAHFAVYPEKLIGPMVKAGCPEMLIDCNKCGIVLGYKYETKPIYQLQEVWEKMSKVQLEKTSPILQQAMQFFLGGEKQKNNKGLDNDDKRIQVNNEARTSQSKQIRVCNGTSVSNGKSYREDFEEQRGSSSQKRNQKRQQDREFSFNDKTTARQNGEKGKESNTNNLSSLWRENTTIGSCPKCKGTIKVRKGVILDCFFGSGTTGLVAQKLKRNWIGIELNPEYIKLADKRLAQKIMI